MMLSLPSDVLLHISRARSADTEGGVASLPCESPLGGKLLMHPARRVGFHDSHQLRDGFVRRKRHKQMHMIRRTVDDERNALSLPDNAAHVWEKPDGYIGRQIWRAVLGGEDDVNQQGSKAVCHKTSAPFRGSVSLLPDSARLAPWATFFRPSGLAAATQSNSVNRFVGN